MNCEFRCNCPVVRVENVKFSQTVLVGGVRQVVCFTRDVIFLRISEPSVILRNKEHDVDVLSIWHDMYGLFLGYRAAQKGIPGVMVKYGICAGDDFGVDIDVSIYDEAVLRPQNEDSLRNNREGKFIPLWRKVPKEWDCENGDVFNVRKLVCAKTVYSSRFDFDTSEEWIAAQKTEAERLAEEVKAQGLACLKW